MVKSGALGAGMVTGENSHGGHGGHGGFLSVEAGVDLTVWHQLTCHAPTSGDRVHSHRAAQATGNGDGGELARRRRRTRRFFDPWRLALTRPIGIG
jgi:hypothetical protein